MVFDAGFSVNVIRLKVPIPKSQGSDEVGGPRFITRMKDTDFFQALSMYSVPLMTPKLMNKGSNVRFHLLQKKRKKQKNNTSKNDSTP